MDPILLIGSIILLAAMLTWVLPAGRFERNRDPSTGRTLVVPGSYKTVPRNPVGPWGVLLAIPQGLIEAASVVFFVLMAGAAITVVEATGAIGNTIDHMVWRFGDRPLLLLALASALFLFGGAAYGMYEEILAFLPVLCALARRLEMDTEIALGISVGTASVGGAFSPFNTFLLGISQPLAELPLFSGFAFRAVVFVLAMGIWGGYLAWYVGRSRRSVLQRGTESHVIHNPHLSKWKPRDIVVLLALNGGMIFVVLGGVFLHWELPEFSAMMILVGLLAGLAGGLGWRGTSEQFAEGIRRIAFAAVLVGLARAITVVLSSGVVLDTIANALFSPLQHLPLGGSATMMFVSESVLAFPMPSDSGRAMMSLPVVIPIADLLGLSRQMAVNAYQFSGVTSGLITPSAGSLLAMLAMAGISYGKWLRFVALPFGLLFVLSAAAMVIGVRLGIQ